MLLDLPIDFTAFTDNADTFLPLDATAKDLRLQMGYKKTYSFPGDFIDGYHYWLSRCPRHPYQMIDIGIEGWLFPADALKLYELAYFAGDILEIGTYKGLSTTAMANAVFNSGRQSSIVSCDLDPVNVAEARIGFRLRQVPDREMHSFVVSEGTEFVKHLGSTGKRFSLVFIDHSHNYEHVFGVCQLLNTVLIPGAFCLFHDYNDPRNMPGIESYGVYQGVRDGFPKDEFDFFGIFGFTGLFRRKGVLPEWFSEDNYLSDHPDVMIAVQEKQLPSGLYHWIHYGKKEGRLLRR